MANICLDRDEAEAGDLPPVCMHCGADAVRLVSRRYFWSPMYLPPLIRMLMTKRMTVQVPACARHASSRFWNGPNLWGECRPTRITKDAITLTKVSPGFVAALEDYRDGNGPEWDKETRRQARKKVRPTPSSGGGGGTAVGIVVLVLSLLVVVPIFMCAGMVGLMFLMRTVAAPMLPPVVTGTPAPTTAVVRPEIVGLIGVAPDAGFPGALPWPSWATLLQTDSPLFKNTTEVDRLLVDLGSRSPFTVADAARKLGQLPPDDERRAEVAQALEKQLANPHLPAREAAALALKVWATDTSEIPLTPLLNDSIPAVRAAAMDALATVKSENAAAAVAKRLGDFIDRDKARKALVAMGSVAEKPVLLLLDDRNGQVRAEACRVLQEIGTIECVMALVTASQDSDRTVAQAAKTALTALQDRLGNPDK